MWIINGTVVVLVFIVSVWAFKMLWNWFVAPLGVRRIGFEHAGGLMLLLNLALNRSPLLIQTPDTFMDVIHLHYSSLLLSLLSILLGSIWKATDKLKSF